MINKENYTRKDQVSTLCDIMINCQCLILDIERGEEDGLFKYDLKRAAKDFITILERSVNAIYGVGHKEIYDAINDGKPEEEIEALKEKHRDSNLEMIRVYEAILHSRKLFDSMSYSDKIMLINKTNEECF